MVNENDFSNNKCNIISDLKQTFNKIREEILLDKKIKNNEMNDNKLLYKLRVPVFTKRYNNSFISRKRHKIIFSDDDGSFNN